MTFLKNKKLTKEASKLFISQCIASGMSFMFILAFARLMGPKNFGIFSLIQFVAYLFLFIQQAITYTPMNINIHKYSINKPAYKWLMLAKLLVLTLLSIIASLILCISIFHTISLVEILSIFVYIFSFSAFDFARKYRIACFNYKKLLSSEICLTLFGTLALSLLILFNKTTQELSYLHGIQLLGITYGTFSIIFLYSYILSTKQKSGLYKKILLLAKKEISTISSLLIANSSQWFISRAPSYFLGFFSSIELVGVLNAGTSLIGFLNPIYISIDSYLIPRFAKKIISSDKEATRIKLAKVYNRITVYLCVLMILAAPFSKLIFKFFLGSQYIHYHYIFYFVLFSYLMQFSSKKFIVWANLINKQSLLAKAHTASLAFTAILSILLIPTFNLMGALLCINTTWIAYYSYLYLCLWKVKQYKPHQKLPT